MHLTRLEIVKKLSALFFFLVLVSAGPCSETNSQAAEAQGFSFPKVDPSHKHMRLLLENAFGYVDPDSRLIDPVSGYPVEGWNRDAQDGVHLRSFTQLTAIGCWVELLANIVAGYAVNPHISSESAIAGLSFALKSLRADQENPSLSAKGLLVNFLDLEGRTRRGPLLESVQRDTFTEAFGEKTGSALWKGLEEKGWMVPQAGGQKGKIRRGEKYGAAYFDGPLAPFSDEHLKSRIMEILDQRVVLVVFGDNVNLTASLAKSVGALLRPEIKDDPRVSGLRQEMEKFLDGQKTGYAHLYDDKTGTFFFGRDATADRIIGWDDGQGNWVRGQMNSFINEFRGPWIFAVLRYGLPEASIRNAGFKIKPYRNAHGREIHVLSAWEGSAFQLLGLSLFMQEHLNPGWRRSLESIVDMELDYSAERGLPGFLSEAYSGNGSEYTGRIGIPDIAVTDKPLITHAPSLYTLGVAYMVSPDKIEDFLESQWSMISSLFTAHGPWEGYNTSANEIIRYQTTAHTLALILGGIGSAHENMHRYLKVRGLLGSLERLYRPGTKANLLSARNAVIPWALDRSPMVFKRENDHCRFQSQRVGICGMTFVVPEDRGISLSNGILHIRYRSELQMEDALVSFKRPKEDPFPTLPIPIELFTRFRNTKGEEENIEIVLPATPALHGIKEISLVFGRSGKARSLDVSVTGFEFMPFDSALAQPD